MSENSYFIVVDCILHIIKTVALVVHV